MGSCTCLSRPPKEIIKIKETIRQEVIPDEDPFAKSESLHKKHSIGPPIPEIPDHPMRNYTFPRRSLDSISA